MKARLAVAGSVMAGLVAVGGVAVAATIQPAQAPATVRMVQPAADVSTIAPTVASTVTPTVTETVAPVVVPAVVAPIAVAPALVESTQAVAPAAPDQKVAVVTNAAVKPATVAADPVVTPTPAQTYPDGSAKFGTVTLDDGTVVSIPVPNKGNAPNIDSHGVPIPTPTP